MTMNVLLSLFADQPALVAPEWAQSLEANFTLLLELPNASEMLAAEMANDTFWPAADSWQASYRPYNVSNGVLTIPVTGAMLNNFSFATPYATGYQYLDKAWERGMADPDVKGIALRVGSGGGHAAGNFDLVDKMVATKTKPVVAICEDACSAAYNIATAADEIHVSRTGRVGSIGVVLGHLDVSENMKQHGFKMTFISAPEGGDKTAGNAYEPLSDAARARIQDSIDELYQHFVDTVSRNRGMEEKAIRATKARTFTASQALSNGLADKVASSEDSMAAFQADLQSRNGEEHMSVKENGTVEAAVHEAAVATARTEGHTAGHAAGLAEGAKAERIRISAILDHAAAADRPVAAMKTAMKTDMSVEDAVAFIADLPKETKSEAAQNGNADGANAHANPNFKEGMDANGGAKVDAGSEANNNQADQLTRMRQLIAAIGVDGFGATQTSAKS